MTGAPRDEGAGRAREPEARKDAAVVHRAEAQRFELQVEGAVAVLRYHESEGHLHLTHTEVPRALRGRGYAKALARAGLEHARREQLRVVPTCPFVARFIQRHPEYVPLLSED